MFRGMSQAAARDTIFASDNTRPPLRRYNAQPPAALPAYAVGGHGR